MGAEIQTFLELGSVFWLIVTSLRFRLFQNSVLSLKTPLDITVNQLSHNYNTRKSN